MTDNNEIDLSDYRKIRVSRLIREEFLGLIHCEKAYIMRALCAEQYIDTAGETTKSFSSWIYPLAEGLYYDTAYNQFHNMFEDNLLDKLVIETE